MTTGPNGYTILYTYNSGGNIVLKRIYSFTTASSITGLSPIDTILYGYDSNWKDMLTSVDGMQNTRDNMGNPTNYYGMSMAWGYGNKLIRIVLGNTALLFNYNQNGLRTGKYIGSYSNRIEYFWIDNVLQSENYVGRYEIVYCYDASGSLIGFTYETANQKTFYHYVKNLQGDVIALLDENYNVVVKYTYDTWGQVLSVTDSSGTLITNTNHIGHINPIRYRGYYYDNESGFYYLQSRYYDPYVGRFISADTYISTGQGILGYNMFAYCGNNPVSRYEVAGKKYIDINDYVDATFEFNPEEGTKERYIWFSIERGTGYSKSFGNDEKLINLNASINDFKGDYSIDASVGIKINFSETFAISFEIGSDASIGIHGDGWNLDFGTNEGGRGYIQWSTEKEGGYFYTKFSFNIPEIVGTVLALIYVPDLVVSVAGAAVAFLQLVRI
ncbi:MAG: RHS repeat-associated core domain-containing protein [Ruminococcaceae bacterium]|nr:RHS repeat-associated core domain-containing protein [Oscillospiraceae bacterium]